MPPLAANSAPPRLSSRPQPRALEDPPAISVSWSVSRDAASSGSASLMLPICSSTSAGSATRPYTVTAAMSAGNSAMKA
jgi:hypothetical protein